MCAIAAEGEEMAGGGVGGGMGGVDIDIGGEFVKHCGLAKACTFCCRVWAAEHNPCSVMSKATSQSAL